MDLAGSVPAVLRDHAHRHLRPLLRGAHAMTKGNGHNASKGGYFRETEEAWGATAPTKPWPDAMRVPLPALREPVTNKPRIDVAATFNGKSILLIGTTGF